VLQAIGTNLMNVTQCHDNSMLALHLPNTAVGDWVRQFEDTGAYMHVKAPIIIGSKTAAGYSASWTHMPLSCTQTFTLFKQVAANKPTHNAWKIFVLNPKTYRQYWSDLQLISPKEYKKSTAEIRRMVPCCTLLCVAAIVYALFYVLLLI